MSRQFAFILTEDQNPVDRIIRSNVDLFFMDKITVIQRQFAHSDLSLWIQGSRDFIQIRKGS